MNDMTATFTQQDEDTVDPLDLLLIVAREKRGILRATAAAAAARGDSGREPKTAEKPGKRRSHADHGRPWRGPSELASADIGSRGCDREPPGPRLGLRSAR